MSWFRVTQTWIAVGLLAMGYMTCVGFVALTLYGMNVDAAFVAQSWPYFALPWGAALLAYGALRVLRAHPFYQPAYLTWLLGTPWKPGLPMPDAPVTPKWQDAAVVLSGVGLSVFHAGADGLWVFVAFAAGVVLAFVPIALYLRYRPLLWAQGLLLISLYHFPYRSVAVMAAAGGLLLTLVALSRSMRRYPWGFNEIGEQAQALSTFFARPQTADTPILQPECLDKAAPLGDWRNAPLSVTGWPLSALAPYRRGRVMHAADTLAVMLLVGWACFNFAWNGAPRATLLCFAFAILRLALYMTSVNPPISLLGRLATGRWIIPKYDRIFVAPLLSLCFALLPLLHLGWGGVPLPLVCALCGALSAGIALAMGPRLGEHQLTSPGRMAFSQVAVALVSERRR